MDSVKFKVLSEVNVDDTKNNVHTTSAAWEHEELAQVRIHVLRGHTGAVKSCQFFTDGRQILTASQDQTVMLWDVHTGEAIKRYEGGHSKCISKARANSNGNRIISTGWDKKVLVWDTEIGKVLWCGDHGGMVTCGSWSHSDKLIVTGSDVDRTVSIWDSHNGYRIQLLKSLHKSTITNAYFSNNDDRIFTTSMDHTAKVWDLKTNTNTITLEGHTSVISDASCTSNERQLATVSWDKSIRIWDISTGQYRSKGCSSIPKAHEGCVSCCNFSQDGSLLVTGGYDNQVLLWDMDNNMLKLRLQGHMDWVEDVCFSPDQKWILSCGKDATVRLWDIENADNIPMVKERNKTSGVKLQSCSQCGKPFSTAKTATHLEMKLCVFCRLQTLRN